MHAQISTYEELYLDLWIQIIRQKISNQSRALSIMGMSGAEKVSKYLDDIYKENVNITEALAAKDYFVYYLYCQKSGGGRLSSDLWNTS